MESKVEKIKADIKKCDEFLSRTEDSFKEDVYEAQQMYDEACKDIKELEEEYAEALRKAADENYGDIQINNLHSFYKGDISAAKEHRDECAQLLKRSRQRLQQYPTLIEDAKKDRAKLEKELAEEEKSIKASSVDFFIIKWAIIAFVILAILMKSGILK